jgi:hypothetical protein
VQLWPLAPEPVIEVMRELAYRRWDGDKTLISAQEFVAAIQAVDTAGQLSAKLRENPLFSPWL